MATENKEVTGIICIPIPPLAKGKHTLSTTYTDTIYQTASKCFQIEVVDSEVTINVGTLNGRPNCTLNANVQVTNELGRAVEDGVIKVYYHNQQDDAQMQTFVNGLSTLLIGSASVGSDGVAHVSLNIPSNVRGGKLILKTTYTHSDLGYDDKTYTSPLYINRGGYLTLGTYKTVDGVKSLVPVNGWINESDTVEVVAALYDDSDSAKVPLAGVPINIKLNDETITLDVPGSTEKSYTNSQGKVSVNTQINTTNETFNLVAINEGKPYVSELSTQHTYRVRKLINTMSVTVSTVDEQARTFVVRAILKDSKGQPASGAVGILKVNDISYKEGDDPIDGNGDTKRFTEDAQTPGTYTMDIDLGDLDEGTKTLTIQFGGEWDTSKYQQKIVTKSLTLVKRNLSVSGTAVTFRNNGASIDFKLTTFDGEYLHRNYQVTTKVNGITLFGLKDSPDPVNSFTNSTGNDYTIKYDKNGNCQVWLPASQQSFEYRDGQSYTFAVKIGSSNVYNDKEFSIGKVYNS